MFDVVTVPLHLEHHRPFVDLTFAWRDGRRRSAHFWVDTGAGSFVLAEPLARDLGVPLDADEDAYDYDGESLPLALLGGSPLDLRATHTFVQRGAGTVLPGIAAEGMLSGEVLSRYRVTLDYPGRRLTLTPAHARAGRGAAVPTPTHPLTQFPRAEIEVAGERVGVLLDTGASYTMISRAVLDRWAAEHPDWPHHEGAVGAANMAGGELDIPTLMLRLPTLAWGPFTIAGAGVVSRPAGRFEERWSRWMAGPIAGALAGNVLTCFRVEIDHAGGITYLEQHTQPDPHDTDLVGLTLRPEPDGGFVVDHVSRRNDPRVIAEIRAGDHLLAVDGAPLDLPSLAAAIDLLRGEPGEERSLLLDRDGERYSCRAPVVRLL